MQLIGASLDWQGEPLSRPQADRFAASLAVGMTSGTIGGRMPQGAAHTLGAATLACAPISAGRSHGWTPLRSRSGQYVLFCGHIDNRADLRAQLSLGPARPGEADGGMVAADGALYAAAHDAWGAEADLRVIGSFAVILFDAACGELTLVRSPFNAPPLHIWHDARRAVVASSPRALFATGDVPRTLNEQKIADSLYLNYSDYAQGWFAGVTRLPVGHRAQVTRRGVAVTRYYDPADVAQVRLSSDEAYVEAAEALLTAATAAALEGATRPAVSLSGGYDSQAVAAYVLRARPGHPLIGLTSVPQEGWDKVTGPRRFGNEWPHVQALAQMYPDLDAQPVPATGLSFDHSLEAMFLLTGVAPRNAMNQTWLHAVRAAARAQGCDRLLTGAWGNLSFSYDGGGAISDWLARGHWGRALREVWAGGSRRYAPRRFWAQGIVPLLPRAVWQGLGPKWRGEAATLDPLNSWCALNPAYMQEMRVSERAADLGFDAEFRQGGSSRAIRKAMMANAAQEGSDLQLGMDVLHGLGSRDPTAYRPLVEFCLGIPDDQYLRGGKKRWLARRMLAGKIPDMVLQERRRGLQTADWALRLHQQRPALLAELDRLAQDPAMAARLNLPVLRRSLQEWSGGTPTDPDLAARLRLALPRAITTARFIRHVDGRNDPG